jgi:hypothetical protein
MICLLLIYMYNTDDEFMFHLISILKFVNLQADAVKQRNSACLVTIGSWSEHAQTDTKAQSSTTNIPAQQFLLLNRRII